AQGPAAETSARSAAPLGLRPHAVAVARNPRASANVSSMWSAGPALEAEVSERMAGTLAVGGGEGADRIARHGGTSSGSRRDPRGGGAPRGPRAPDPGALRALA